MHDGSFVHVVLFAAKKMVVVPRVAKKKKRCCVMEVHTAPKIPSRFTRTAVLQCCNALRSHADKTYGSHGVYKVGGMKKCFFKKGKREEREKKERRKREGREKVSEGRKREEEREKRKERKEKKKGRRKRKCKIY